MPVLIVIAVLFSMQLLGQLVVRFTGLPLPGSLIGLLLLFACLVYLGRIPKVMRDTSGHILQHLMLLFIAPTAGIMLHFDRIAREWLPFVAASIVATLITIVVTALTFRWMLRRQKEQIT